MYGRMRSFKIQLTISSQIINYIFRNYYLKDWICDSADLNSHSILLSNDLKI